MSTLYVNNLYPQTGSQVSLIGNLSASINVSASKFYGDGAGITGVTGEWDGTIVGSMSGSSTLEVVGATYLGSTLGVTGAVTAASYSGSSTLQTVGATTLGSTLAVSGNVGVATSPSAPLHVYKAATSLNSNPLELIRLESQDEGVDMNAGHGPAITFYVGETGGSDHGGTVAVVREAAGDADSAAAMVFHTAIDDTTPAERMRITSTGLVGVGTSSPSNTLTVAGAISGSGALQTAGATILGSTLKVSGTTTLAGTTNAQAVTATTYSGSSTMEVVGNAFFGGNLSVSGTLTHAGTSTFTSLSASSTLEAVGATTLGSTLAVSGNVGIATSPSAPLHVYKAAAAGTATPMELLRLEQQDEGVDMDAGHGPALTFYVGETGGSDHGGTVAVVREQAGDADSAAAMSFYTAGDDSAPTEKMRITSAGLVGIGTTSPTQTLTVAGDVSGSATMQIVGGAIFGNVVNVTGTVSSSSGFAGGQLVIGNSLVINKTKAINAADISGSGILACVGGITTAGGLNLQNTGISAAGSIAGASTYSGSSTLENVGAVYLGSTLGVTGNIASANGNISTSNGNISVGGAGTWYKGPGGGLAVSGYMSGSGVLEVVGASYFGNTLSATGSISGTAGFAGKQLIIGNAAVIDKTRTIANVQGISGSGALQIVGTSNLQGNVTLSGSISAVGGLNVGAGPSATINAGGAASFGQLTSSAASFRGKFTKYQPAPEVTNDGTGVITAANIATGIVLCTPTADRSKATDSAANLQGALGFGEDNDSFDFSVINLATDGTSHITITAGASVTLVGCMVVSAQDLAEDAFTSGVGRFRLRRTSAANSTLYRIA